MTTPTPQAPARVAQAGDSFYLDGFWYVLGAPERHPASPDLVLPFYRPDEWARRQAAAQLAALKARDPEAWAATTELVPDHFAPYRANFNYKRDGITLEAPRWVTRAELLDAIEAQADQLIASNPRRRVWARAARAAQRAALPADLAGAWVLEGRVLLKPTCVRATHPDPTVQRVLEVNPPAVEPQAEAEARPLAEAILTSAPTVFAQIQALTSWASPAGATLHSWEG